MYANAHAYHINSVSVNCDGETFISSDDLRVNLWNLEINHTAFNVVDLKPPNMEDLVEVRGMSHVGSVPSFQVSIDLSRVESSRIL